MYLWDILRFNKSIFFLSYELESISYVFKRCNSFELRINVNFAILVRVILETKIYVVRSYDSSCWVPDVLGVGYEQHEISCTTSIDLYIFFNF